MYKKENIPNKLKKKIWDRYTVFPNYLQITQCTTCENIILIPESIRKYYPLIRNYRYKS